MNFLPALLFRQRRSHVDLAFLPGDLGVQLLITPPAPRVEFPCQNRLLNRTASLASMRAIAEAAPKRQFGNIAKCRVDTRGPSPQSQLAHPGGVDECSAIRQRDEFTIGRRMPASA